VERVERKRLSNEINVTHTDLGVIIEVEDEGTRRKLELTNTQMSLVVAEFIKKRNNTEWTEELEEKVIEEIASYLGEQMTFMEILEKVAYKFNISKTIIKKRWAGEGEYECLKDKYDIAVKNSNIPIDWREEELDRIQRSIERYLVEGGTSIAWKLKQLSSEYGVKAGDMEKIWHGFQGAPSIRDRFLFDPYSLEKANKAGNRQGQRVKLYDSSEEA
jgi:predicted house-cleaning noncanonical NTP pyrophosphatase (MazG superfamily)